MTDYLLANGTNKAPAVRAPGHMASWLDAHGYRIVRSPGPGPGGPGDPELVARIAAQIDWPPSDDDRHAIVRQVLAAVVAGNAVTTDLRRVA